ncbi:MAG: iron-containing alcohol dehydrogenase [Desulfovibrio sp.]|nr:iron-containing alcohol dehydrogenase [Desulfovibrio sp.]
MYRNAKNVGYYMIGDGALDQLHELMIPQRDAMPDAPVIYFIDHFFKKTDLVQRVPILEWDMRIFVDTTDEPTCESVDKYASEAKKFLNGKKACALIALGGGSTMDTCKCVGNLLTNPGDAADYQGWDLVKNPAPYKVAIPTLSGTGSETSRTGIMTNKKKGIKLGMNSDYSMFDQVLLDPRLPMTAPRDQYFYTGVDCFMHCFEYLDGQYRNKITDAFAEKALELTKEVFLSDDMMSNDNREKLMIASYKGGMAAGFVGVVHPFSAGLSIVLGMHHGLANCYALSVLGDIYPEPYRIFNEMMSKQGITLKKGICANLSPEQYDQLYEASIVHEKPLMNKLGEKYREILTKENVIDRFKQM